MSLILATLNTLSMQTQNIVAVQRYNNMSYYYEAIIFDEESVFATIM